MLPLPGPRSHAAAAVSKSGEPGRAFGILDSAMPTAHSCPHTGNSGVPPYLLPSNSRVPPEPQRAQGGMGRAYSLAWHPCGADRPAPRGCGLLREEPVPISEIRGEAVWAGPRLIELIAPFAACNRTIVQALNSQASVLFSTWKLRPRGRGRCALGVWPQHSWMAHPRLLPAGALGVSGFQRP